MDCVCVQCGLEKSQSDFYFRKNRNKHRSECKDCTKKNASERYSKTRPTRLSQMKEYNDKNRDEHKTSCREYYRNNTDSILNANKQWRDAFRQKTGMSYNNYRYRNDLNHKLRCIIRNRITDALQSQNIELYHVDIGCSILELKQYLESKFQFGMTWENWSLNGWHIDHIKPLIDFDLSNEEQYKQACHYTNLQPLWAKDNWYKNRSINKRSRNK